jgi:hypothetical protein
VQESFVPDEFLNSFMLRVNPSLIMEKRTLKFDCLIHMALFSKQLTSGYLMNTNNFTLTGKFSDTDIDLAIKKYKAALVETTEKVFSYEVLL